MENSLWTFGCSFTAEYHPIDNDPPTTYDFYKQYNGGELPKVWSEQLSEKLGLKYENKGRGATSNASIFYSFCNFCDKLQEDDIVIVQWTTIYRFLLANDDLGELCDILPSCEYPDNEYDMDLITAMLVNRSNPIWIECSKRNWWCGRGRHCFGKRREWFLPRFLGFCKKSKPSNSK